MKKFKFPLEQVLTLKQEIAWEREVELAKAVAACEKTKEEIEQCRKIRYSPISLSADMADYYREEVSKSALLHKEKELKKRLSAQESEQKERAEAYHNAYRESRVMELYREKMVTQYKKESHQKVIRELDEISQTALYNKKKYSEE